VAAALAAVIGFLNHDLPLDLLPFAALGQLVLAGRFGEAYAGTFTQAGPLQLVLSRVLLIGGHGGTPATLPSIVVDVALVLGAMAAARGRSRREIAVGVLTLLWLLGPVPWNGHPVEVAVPVLWAYGMVLSASNRWPAAAVALGVSVLIAPLAVLGFPCLLAAGKPVRTALLGLGVALAGYLPFVLSGPFGMFGHVWPVRNGTLPHLLGLSEMSWTARLGQAAVVAGGCALVAVLLRGKLVAVAAAPLAACLLRVVTDPLVFKYYWVPVAVGSVLLVALLPDDRSIWPFVVAGYVTVMAATTGQAALGALVCLACYLAIIRPVRLGASVLDRSDRLSAALRRG
jgi:hypothetical protein